MNFAYHAPPSIRFGRGVLREIGRKSLDLGAKNVLVVTSPGMLERSCLGTVLSSLEEAGLSSQVFARISPDPPIEEAELCLEAINESEANLVIGLGGGSAMDVAKIAAMLACNPLSIRDYFGVGKVSRPGLPTILAPTTAGSGSEVSPDAVLVDTVAGTKKAVVDNTIISMASFVDPEVILSMPAQLTAVTGIDALTHAIEAFVSRRASPITDEFALQAIQLIATNLTSAVTGSKAEQEKAKEQMALASTLAGLAFGNAGTAAVHACAYPITGMFSISHGMANGLMLSAVTEFNLQSTSKYNQIADRFGVETINLPGTLSQLVEDIGLPTRLSQVGISRESIPQMVEVVLPDDRHLSVNPRKIERNELEVIFEQAS